MNKFPDDLNNWSQQNFDEVRKIFEKTINRNEMLLIEKNNTNSVNNLTEFPKVQREKVIQKDDILNLQIMLNQIQNVDDFIKNM